MKRILALCIPHKHQRYDTVGDYFDCHGATCFSISDMDNEWYERLVFLHEFVEETLCRKRGIQNADIDAFDVAFEAARLPDNEEEPGHQLDAPYHREHVFAEKLERLMAEELGIDWDTYDKTVTGL